MIEPPFLLIFSVLLFRSFLPFLLSLFFLNYKNDEDEEDEEELSHQPFSHWSTSHIVPRCGRFSCNKKSSSAVQYRTFLSELFIGTCALRLFYKDFFIRRFLLGLVHQNFLNSFLFVVGEGYSPVTQSLFQMFKRTFVLLQTKFNDTFVAILTFTKTEEKYNN